MKRTLILALFIVLAFTFFVLGDDPLKMDAKGIIDKCASAMGGWKKIQNIETLRIEVKYPGHDYIVVTDIQRPNLMRNSGGRGIGIFNGKQGCILKKNPETAKFDDVELITNEFLADFYVEPGFFTFYFFDFPSEYLGLSEVNGKAVHTLEVKLPLNTKIHYQIDAHSYLPVRTVAHVILKGKNVQWGRDYIEYVELDGILYPKDFTYYWGNRKPEKATVKSLAFNVTFPANHFLIPRQK